jgi:hypothetical protein
MAFDPNDAVKIPHASTGPRTDAGKARSSQNATKTGLYAAHDFIRNGEEQEYTETLTSLMHELAPHGALEETFATEIMGATWRLRRCRMVEEDLAEISILDPMVDEQTAKQQKSVDRARAQSLNIMRRCIADLRQLQTNREIRTEMNCAPGIPVLADIRQVSRTVESFEPDSHPPKMTQKETFAEIERLMGMSDAQLQQYAIDPAMSYEPAGQAAPAASSFCEPDAPVTPFCKPGTATPRNAPCPCGSGDKYKRCCGKNAPPVLNLAA